MSKSVLLTWVAVVFGGVGCSVSAGPDGGDPERGPIGKADLVGSCTVDHCGGPAAVGNCWCDDQCAVIGDCCVGKADVCPDLCQEDADCGDAQVCDHSECLSNCPAGGACPDVCFGACIADPGACCEPDAAPQCFEGATCCEDGTWECNPGLGGPPPCDAGTVCEPEPPCCEPDAAPQCFEGATCCEDGTWECNPGLGGPQPCDAGTVCEPEPPCCEPADAPQCFEGATCCEDGTWECNPGLGGPSPCDVGLICA